MSVLVVTTEPLPFPGVPVTGAGLRAWALVQGLRSFGLEAEPAIAADAARHLSPEQAEPLKPFLFERHELTDHVRARKPDALVMQHWGLMDRLGPVDCPLAIDLAGPHLLERHFWGSAHPERDLADKLAALRRADFLTCSGRRQRLYFLGFAMQEGFDPADPNLLPVIPFSVSPQLPVPREFDPTAFVYAGLLLPWQDPSRGLEALLRAFERHNRGHLTFIGATHPAGDVSRGQFDSILQRIQASSQASLEPARAFTQLQEDLGRFGVAWDFMALNAERELAFPSRTVVYLSCGLPVVTQSGHELADWIARYDAGWNLDPASSDEHLEAFIERLLDAPDKIADKRENARRLVREKLTWDRTIAPLADWCRNPTRRSGKNRQSLQTDETLQALRRESEQLRESLQELQGRRLVRLSNLLRRIGWRRGS
jgi:hypothetical protein